MTPVIENSTTINAPPSEVWRALTDPDLMKLWMAELVMRIEITSDWNVGSPIVVKGHHNNVMSTSRTKALFCSASRIRFFGIAI
jgi:uncharacterized protein YndB with AHSA1/START domain